MRKMSRFAAALGRWADRVTSSPEPASVAWCFLVVAFVLIMAVVSVRAEGIVIDFATQAPDLAVLGTVSGRVGHHLGADVKIGDLDGDGVADLVIGAPFAEGPANRTSAGHVYVFFGGGQRPATLAGDDADVVIIGAAALDAIGGGFNPLPNTIAIGDVDGDAFDDLILGVPEAQANDGQVYIIFGRDRDAWEATSTIDLATDGDHVVVMSDAARTWLGSAVAVGDLDGDGIGDLIAGARFADVPEDERTDAGKVYVFFGRSSWPDALFVETDADVEIIGAGSNHWLGSGLAVGQLGSTGVADLVMGARFASGPGGDLAGEVHVVFGSAGFRNVGTRDLAEEPADWIVYGADAQDVVGRHLAVGDVSGDGQPDLVIGIPDGDGPEEDRVDAGEVAVLFGPRTSGTTTNLADGADVTIFGPEPPTGHQGNRLGNGVGLGDFNGDGVMDIVAGAGQGDGFNDQELNAGEAYVVFGGDLPSALDLNSQDADITVYGEASNDGLRRVAGGDLDGVPPDDLALGAPEADVEDGGPLTDAGKVFVLYRQLTEPTATVTPTVTVTGSPTATPTTTATPAPQNLLFLPLVMKDHS